MCGAGKMADGDLALRTGCADCPGMTPCLARSAALSVPCLATARGEMSARSPPDRRWAPSRTCGTTPMQSSTPMLNPFQKKLYVLHAFVAWPRGPVAPWLWWELTCCTPCRALSWPSPWVQLLILNVRRCCKQMSKRFLMWWVCVLTPTCHLAMCDLPFCDACMLVQACRAVIKAKEQKEPKGCCVLL